MSHSDGEFLWTTALGTWDDDYDYGTLILEIRETGSYDIVFSANGGDGLMDELSETRIGLSLELPTCIFAYQGHTFIEWNTEADGTGTSYEDEATVSNLTTTDGDTVTLYAQWEPITYAIAFDGNGADEGEMESIEATYDEEYTLTTNAFTRDGYTFTGWNTEADGSGTSYEDEATVSNLTTEDGVTVTLYAQWKEYTITVTEYTGDTLEADYDYEDGYFILYVVDPITLEQNGNAVLWASADVASQYYYLSEATHTASFEDNIPVGYFWGGYVDIWLAWSIQFGDDYSYLSTSSDLFFFRNDDIGQWVKWYFTEDDPSASSSNSGSSPYCIFSVNILEIFSTTEAYPSEYWGVRSFNSRI